MTKRKCAKQYASWFGRLMILLFRVCYYNKSLSCLTVLAQVMATSQPALSTGIDDMTAPCARAARLYNGPNRKS